MFKKILSLFMIMYSVSSSANSCLEFMNEYEDVEYYYDIQNEGLTIFCKDTGLSVNFGRGYFSFGGGNHGPLMDYNFSGTPKPAHQEEIIRYRGLKDFISIDGIETRVQRSHRADKRRLKIDLLSGEIHVYTLAANGKETLLKTHMGCEEVKLSN